VKVDDFLRTSNPRIYACGDVCLEKKFTHAADFTARLVIQNALFFGRKRLSSLVVPWCTYTDPEVAHVGMYEGDARAAGLAAETFVRELKDVDRAVVDGETEGFVKVLAQKGGGRVLGATVVARHAGEMIGELTLAVKHGLKLGALADVIHPYPTQAEAVRQTGDLYNRARLTPAVKALLAGLLRWRR
jgi:pyruvate/2-oxoglutarate dehydrogenase complex dihydrolipoamide dehydrogenase (E3) component